MTRRRRLLWQLYPTYALLILLCIVGVAGYAFRSVKSFHYSQVSRSLEATARLLQGQVAHALDTGEQDPDTLAVALSEASGARVTIISPDGEVVGESHKDTARMDNHSDRPEVIEATSKGVGRSVRRSDTLRADMMYVAVPIAGGTRDRGVVRAALPLTELDEALAAIERRLWLGGATIALLAAGLSIALVRRIGRPLKEMADGAGRFAAGDFAHKVLVPDTAELAELAVALNRMAAELDEKIRTVTLERNEREAILTSMTEGVLAVDGEQRIISLNQAAARLFNVEVDRARGRRLQEVVRSVLLERFAGRALTDSDPVEGEIVLHNGGERFVQLRGNPLVDAKGEDIGALIVLNDVTRIRRLETMRRDFVANVSHELRTPVTAIRGWAETLRDGAVEDPRKAQRFLDIIANQADRLNAIFDDLLSLSAVEQQVSRDTVEFSDVAAADVLHGAAAVCAGAARERGIDVTVRADAPEPVRGNAQLLEQAVVNLLDNALKHSQADSTVALEVDQDDGETVIRVRDHGCGIAADHLPRIFERFYRVDKGRSRGMGGTGLGLAIVKHIAQAHGGQVSVESTPGKGSVFSIHIPRS